MGQQRSSKRVKRIVDFIEQLTVPSGTGAGRPFRMRRFQRAFIRDVYGPVDADGNRVVRRAILILIEGELERSRGVINIMAEKVAALDSRWGEGLKSRDFH